MNNQWHRWVIGRPQNVLSSINHRFSLIIGDNQWLTSWLLIDYPSITHWCYWSSISYSWFLDIKLQQTVPFLVTQKNKDGTVTYEGYSIDLLNELARRLKFIYDIYLTPDGKYGAIRKNGTWNGMIGELLNEVCVAPFSFIKFWLHNAHPESLRSHFRRGYVNSDMTSRSLWSASFYKKYNYILFYKIAPKVTRKN